MKYLLITLMFIGCTSNQEYIQQRNYCDKHNGVYSYASKGNNLVCNDKTIVGYSLWKK